MYDEYHQDNGLNKIIKVKSKILKRYGKNNINEKKNKEDYFCVTHNINYKIYCATCIKDICYQCKKEDHSKHKLIYYKDILPDLKEIIIIKKYFIEYENVYKNIIEEINNWKKEIQLLITSFENEIKNISNILNKFDTDKLNFNEIYKFRSILELLKNNSDETSKNKKILKIINNIFNDLKPFYNNNDILLKEFSYLLTLQQLNTVSSNLSKKNDFLQKSHIILELLKNNETNKNKIKDDMSFIKNKESTNDNSYSKNDSFHSISSIISNLSAQECNNIFLDNQNININRHNNITRVYSRKKIGLKNNNENNESKELKKEISIFDYRNICKSYSSEKTNNKKMNEIQKSINEIRILSLYKENKYDTFEDTNKKHNLKKVLRNSNKKQINHIPICPYNNFNDETKTNNNCCITERNTLSNLIRKTLNNENYKENNFNTTIQSNLMNNVEILNKNLGYFSLRNKQNTKIFVHRKFITSLRDIKNEYKYKYNSNNNKIEIQYNDNKPLNVGFELSNTECKIGMFNEKEKGIEIFKFSEKGYGIPTIISFDNYNSNIKIGEEAKQNKNSSKQIFFNFVKLIGMKYNEIKDRDALHPFELYNNDGQGYPYVQIKNINENKNKTICYTIEDLLILFLRKLFGLFLDKIRINDNKNENMNNSIVNLKINMVITVPNYFSYAQRKIIEKIFKTKLFPLSNNYADDYSHKSILEYKIKRNNNYDITLNHILIENVSNLASFCLNNQKNINKLSNILLLYIEGNSVNLSIISISEKIHNINNRKYNSYKVKAIEGLSFGEQDILDNFIYSCLSDFNKDIRIYCLKSFDSLNTLRKSCEIAINYFNKNDDDHIQTEINIKNFYENKDLNMTVNKVDYDKICINYFEKIIFLIKEVLKKSDLNETDFDDIILIGNMTKNYMLKKMISNIFLNNKKIVDNLLNKENNYDDKKEYYTVTGAILQSLNANLLFPKYKLQNISNTSIGIESLYGVMELCIKKGCELPISKNILVKIKKPEKDDMIIINIYEGDDKYIVNNKLIATDKIGIDILKKELKKDYYEILFQFNIDSNNNFNLFILDSDTLQKKHECLVDDNN